MIGATLSRMAFLSLRLCGAAFRNAISLGLSFLEGRPCRLGLSARDIKGSKLAGTVPGAHSCSACPPDPGTAGWAWTGAVGKAVCAREPTGDNITKTAKQLIVRNYPPRERLLCPRS